LYPIETATEDDLERFPLARRVSVDTETLRARKKETFKTPGSIKERTQTSTEMGISWQRKWALGQRPIICQVVALCSQ